MLTAAFDAGGDETTPILTVAGFISSAKDWEDFSKLWKARLSRENIKYFRAVEAAHFNGEFRPWKDRPDRDVWRKNLFSDLMDIALRHAYRHFACSIVNKDFAQMSPQFREEFYLTAYTVAGRTCEKKVREWIATDWRNTKATVELVFEEGDQGKGKLQKRLSHDHCFLPTFRPKQDMVLDDGEILRGFVPLQAADWYAYELSIATGDLVDGKKEIACIGDLRWPLQQFLRRKPGNPGVFAVDDLKKFEKNIELYKDLKNWWASLKD